MPIVPKIAAGILASLALAGVPLLAAQPVSPAVAAGLFPPWWSQAEILAAAAEAGEVQGVGSLPFIVVVRSEAGDAGHRLLSAGAWLTLNPFGVAACAGRTP